MEVEPAKEIAGAWPVFELFLLLLIGIAKFFLKLLWTEVKTLRKISDEQEKKIIKLQTIQEAHTEKFDEITTWLKKISGEIKALGKQIHEMELKHAEDKRK